MILKGLINRIRRRTREQYDELLHDLFLAARIWMQERPEQACVVSFVVGAAAMLFFWSTLVVSVLMLITVSIIWGVALPESKVKARPGQRVQNEGET